MRALFGVLIAAWLIVVAWSGLMMYGFYKEDESNHLAVLKYVAESGVTLDSLRSVRDPWSQYLSGEPKPPARERMLVMAMLAQGKTDRFLWPRTLGEWLLFFVVLPAGGLVALRRWFRLQARARAKATP